MNGGPSSSALVLETNARDITETQLQASAKRDPRLGGRSGCVGLRVHQVVLPSSCHSDFVANKHDKQAKRSHEGQAKRDPEPGSDVGLVPLVLLVSSARVATITALTHQLSQDGAIEFMATIKLMLCEIFSEANTTDTT